MADAAEESKRPNRRKRSFLPGAKVVRARGPIGEAIAESLREYDRSSRLEIPRLTRPSARKAVVRFGSFCFKQREHLSLTRRDPEALERSLLAWFEGSDFVDRLLKLGRGHRRQIEESLEIFVDGYDDVAIPEMLPDSSWWPKPDDFRVERADDISFAVIEREIQAEESDATALTEASRFYERKGDEKQSKRTAKDAQRCLRRASQLRRTLEHLEENFGAGPRAEGAGAPGPWLTPVLADMEEALRGVRGRWGLLAQLVQEIEKKPDCDGEGVRSRVTEFRRRFNRK